MRDNRRIALSFGTWIAGLLLLTFSSVSVHADTPRTARIVRLTYTEGYVRVDRHDSTAGDPAQVNMPLVEGQSVITGDTGQAEIEFEDGSVARVTPNSVFSLASLAVDQAGTYTTRLALAKGLAYFELRAAPRFVYSVDAGGDIISPAENTTLRVNLDEAPAAVAVFVGAAHVERMDSYKIDVKAGETFRSDISNPGRYFLTQEIASDTWDQWNEARDQAAADSASRQTTVRDSYAGSQGYGWSDLDANGSWYNVPGQGQVWQPNGGDAADFDPYDNGSWMWYPGGGYLWASSYNWGWVPFRCGGWSYWNTFGWGWSPNGGCGGFGFAGYGGYGYGGYGGFGYGGGYGGYVNVILPPRRYPIHHPPGGTGTGGGVHPIIAVHNTASVAPGGLRPVGQPLQGVRHIAGVVATPLRPVGQVYTPRGGSAVGASLLRDFPVDRNTHTAMLGVQPVHQPVQNSFVTYGAAANGGAGNGRVGGVVQQQPGFRPSPQQGLQQGYQPGVQPGMRPVPGNYARPVPQYGAQSGSQSGSRQSQQAAPHYSAPAPQPSHQSYSAPAPAPAMSHSAPAAAPSGGGGKH